MSNPELRSKVNNDRKLPAHRMNMIDKAITFFNPEAGEKRMISRNRLHQFGYNDDRTRRGGSGGQAANGGSETFTRSRDRVKAMWDARDLCEYEFIGGMIDKIVLYTCGKIQSKSDTGDPASDEYYDQYFHNWCGDMRSEDETTMCDITGRNRLSDLIRIAVRGFLIDGDHGFVEVAPEFSPTGRYCLQNIEADRIGSPQEAITNEAYIDGVGIDTENGRVQFYRVFQRTRTGMYKNPQEIAPNSFIHFCEQTRSDQYRGRTKLMRLLNDARDIKEWIEAEKIAGKTQSQYAAMVGSKDPHGSQGPSIWDDKDPKTGLYTADAQWGKILRMGEGDSFNMMTPSNRPSGAFMAFVQFLLRKMAISLDLPYGFLWDLAALGGVTARIEVQGAHRKLQDWQGMIEDQILNRVRRKVIAEGIALGELQAVPNWQRAKWNFGPWIVTDAGYEMGNDISAVTNGILPISDITSKYGYSPVEVFRSNAGTANAAIQVGAEAMVPVEAFAAGLYPALTDQKASMVSPPPPPPPGSLQAIGDKGVAQLVDVVTAVGEGKLDRESGVSILVQSFGIPQAIAEKMIPDPPKPSSGAGTGGEHWQDGGDRKVDIY